ncbi:MAG: hypothetical protein QXF56_03270 [Candidatus Micrarchaeia archaeon]
MKGQAAVELLIVASLMMFVLFLLFQFGETNITQSTSIAQLSEARNTVDKLAEAATEVHNEGVGARRRVYITIPDRVDSSRVIIENSTITIGVYAGDGVTDVSSRVNFPVRMGGNFPTTPGSYWVWVVGREGYIQIGSTLEVQPMNVYVELFPSNSTNLSIQFTNYGNSDANVTLSLFWEDPETNASINGTAQLSFILSPGVSNLQKINLNATAYLNASTGLHSGYLWMTTNVSDEELIPVVINVVLPQQTAGGVSYLTIATYNNSAYTLPDLIFLPSESVYYEVKSYNSTDGLVNSTIIVRIYNTYSVLVDEEIYTPNSGTGVYRGSYTIPSASYAGRWSISVRDIGGANTKLYFTVAPQQLYQTTLGTATVDVPFTPSQRAICRDGKGYVHVVWRYNSTSIAYARSTDNGGSFSLNTTFFGATSTPSSSKGYPHISCYGDTVTVSYVDESYDDLVIGISTNNGVSWMWSAPITSGTFVYSSAERSGNRIYAVYVNDSADYSIFFINSTDGGNTWGTPKKIFPGADFGQFGYVHYESPSLAVSGSGDSSDVIYVSAKEIDYDGQNTYTSLVFNKSTDAGATWGAGKTIISGDCGVPSITTNGSAVFITTNKYDLKSVVVLNTSWDGGATWLGENVSDTNFNSYSPTSTLNSTMPFIVWANSTYSGAYLFYRNYNGSGWDSIIKYSQQANNTYPNAKWNCSYNCVEFVHRNGTTSPYNILYNQIGACSPP